MNYYFETLLTKYATFTGRSRRKEYWLFILFNIIVGFVFALIETFIGVEFGLSKKPVSAIYALIMFIPSIAVGIRRLHDTGRSGWWFLLPLLSFLLFPLPFLLPNLNLNSSSIAIFVSIIGIISLIASLIVIVFLCQNSQAGENQYGSNPKITPTADKTELAVIDDTPKATKIVPHIISNIPSKTNNNELFWAKALAEYEGNHRRPGLYAQMFSEAQGNESLTKAHYLQHRVKELFDEHSQQTLAETPAAIPISEPVNINYAPTNEPLKLAEWMWVVLPVFMIFIMIASFFLVIN